jgi:hypothetical protein
VDVHSHFDHATALIGPCSLGTSSTDAAVRAGRDLVNGEALVSRYPEQVPQDAPAIGVTDPKDRNGRRGPG